jgi:hypothetical protein
MWDKYLKQCITKVVSGEGKSAKLWFISISKNQTKNVHSKIVKGLSLEMVGHYV